MFSNAVAGRLVQLVQNPSLRAGPAGRRLCAHEERGERERERERENKCFLTDHIFFSFILSSFSLVDGVAPVSVAAAWSGRHRSWAWASPSPWARSCAAAAAAGKAAAVAAAENANKKKKRRRRSGLEEGRATKKKKKKKKKKKTSAAGTSAAAASAAAATAPAAAAGSAGTTVAAAAAGGAAGAAGDAAASGATAGTTTTTTTIRARGRAMHLTTMPPLHGRGGKEKRKQEGKKTWTDEVPS